MSSKAIDLHDYNMERFYSFKNHVYQWSNKNLHLNKNISLEEHTPFIMNAGIKYKTLLKSLCRFLGLFQVDIWDSITDLTGTLQT